MGWSCVLWFSTKEMCLFSAHHQSLSPYQVPCVVYWSNWVQPEEEDDEQKEEEEEEEEKNGHSWLWSKWIHFNIVFYLMVAMITQKDHINAYWKMQFPDVHSLPVMLDNQCHPYILSITVLGDQDISVDYTRTQIRFLTLNLYFCCLPYLRVTPQRCPSLGNVVTIGPTWIVDSWRAMFLFLFSNHAYLYTDKCNCILVSI